MNLSWLNRGLSLANAAANSSTMTLYRPAFDTQYMPCTRFSVAAMSS